MKNLIALPLLFFVLQGCAAADIRPDDHRRAPTAEETTQGRALLRAMAEAHGEAAYREKTAIEATIDDDWSMAPLPIKLFKPLPGEKLRYQVRIRPGSKDTVLTFLDGENLGQVWGIEGGAAFQEKDGKRGPAEDPTTMENSVGIIGYLLHAPFMLESAKTVAALSPQEVNGKTYERVFFSWGTGEVNDDDQFIAWADAKTKRLSYLQFTARSARKSLAATIELSGHREIGGVIVPGAMILTDGVGGPPKLHAMTVVEASAEPAARVAAPTEAPSTEAPSTSTEAPSTEASSTEVSTDAPAPAAAATASEEGPASQPS